MDQKIKYRRLFFFDLFFAALLLLVFTNKHFVLQFTSEVPALKFVFALFFLRLLFLLHAIWCGLKWMYFSLIKNHRPSKHTWLKWIIFYLTLFFLAAECVFMFVPQSQGNTPYGLGKVAWNMYYANACNEKKYRDRDLAGRINNGRKKVFFLGDSFTFGHGIKKMEDRFSDIVSKRISNKGFETFNLGRGNSDTKDEFIRLAEFGSVPDVLFLQYYYNDIDGAAAGNTQKSAQKNKTGELIFKAGIAVLHTSCFLNFMAVNLAKFASVSKSPEFKRKTINAYHDPVVLKQHLSDLQNILNYCKYHKTKLYVIIIPDLRDPAFSQMECYPPILDYLRLKNIACLNIYEDVKGLTTAGLVVSPVDAHANERVQKIIAEKIVQNVPEFNR